MAIMYRVTLTPYQLNEAHHKYEVMRDDGCEPGTMAAHYGFTDATLFAFGAKLGTRMTLTEQEVVALYGEIGNAADIASDNIGYGEDDAHYRAAVRSFRSLQDKLQYMLPGVRAMAGRGVGVRTLL